MEVLVEYDYSAMNADELTIKKGERIRNVVRKEEGWFEGELVGNGRRGVFPDNFVKQVKPSVASAAPVMKPIGFNVANNAKSPEDKKRNFQNGSKYVPAVPALSPPPPPPPSSSQQQQQQQQPNTKINPLVTPPKPLPVAESSGFLAKVLYTYVPVNEDELPVQENDTVQVLRLVEDGWYEGMYNGRQGVFPSNYVERITEMPQQQQLLNSSAKNDSLLNTTGEMDGGDYNDGECLFFIFFL
jgi:hypothetical protein